MAKLMAKHAGVDFLIIGARIGQDDVFTRRASVCLHAFGRRAEQWLAGLIYTGLVFQFNGEGRVALIPLRRAVVGEQAGARNRKGRRNGGVDDV